MSTELIPHSRSEMTIGAAVQRRDMMVQFTRECMNINLDYGVIPGTNKPTLLKAGAEKLCTLFSMVPSFDIVEKIEDWTGKERNGEPFFYYVYRCSLTRNGEALAQADGSCNSWEKKYRYRNAERTCPACGASTIFPSKDERGSFFCWKSKGGCGRQFKAGSEEAEHFMTATAKVPNPDIFDAVNTIQKMAQKRAFIAAVLIGANASEYYTQDLEDFHETPVGTVNAQTGEVVQETRQEEAAEQRQPKRKDAVLTQLAERQKAIGYEGKVKPLVSAVLGEDITDFTLDTYEKALARPVQEWRLAAEMLKQDAELKEAGKPTPPQAQSETDDEEDGFIN